MNNELQLDDFNKRCRTCLTEASNDLMVDLFAETDGCIVANVLECCTLIKITKGDSLPDKLCDKCYKCLINFYNFRKAAIENDVKLHAELNTNKNIPLQFKIEICDIKSDSNIDTNIDIDSTNYEFSDCKDEKEFNLDNEHIKVTPETIVKNKFVHQRYSCKKCENKYRKHSQLERHVLLKHPPSDNFMNNLEQKAMFMEHLLLQNDKTNTCLSELDQNENQNFKCEVCFLHFKSLNSLSAHKRVHTMKGRILACSHCGKVFKKWSHLKRHELVHDINRAFKCDECPKSFTSEELLTEHLNKHKGVKPHTCPVCSKSFAHISALSNHIKTNKCEYKFRKGSQLERHVLLKHSPSDNSMNNLEQKAMLMEHLVLQNDKTNTCLSKLDQNENQNFKCEVCFIHFKSLNSLSAHKRVHTMKGRILACSHCGKVFKKWSHLKRHELIHDINRPFKCDECPKSFTSEELLTEHLNKHKGVKPHTCPVCNKSFAHLSTLSNHIKIHNKEKHYLCPTCGKRFDSSNNLKQHLNRHLGIKLFACTMCPRAFVTKGELISHNITHTGEKKHSCDECGSTFTKNSSLRKHKLVHLGIKPHQCQKCPMRFTCKEHLKRHYRIHTGEKPYQCDICNRAFTQSNDLVKHKRAHLGDKLYKCDQCTDRFRLKTELRFHLSKHFIDSQMATLNINDNNVEADGAASNEEKQSKMDTVPTTSEDLGTKLE